MKFNFDNSYANNMLEFCEVATPESCSKPSLVYFNHGLAQALGIDSANDSRQALADIFSGNLLPDSSQPIAQAYAGHQFGHFNPQLGDGRALIIGEHIDNDNRRIDICLKGSGQTAFSRGGDGRAALGPMLREVLIAEAMHAMGVPTTRSLAVVATGDYVFRDGPIPGAVLTRTAASHLRIGTFEYFASRNEFDKVKQLADYAIDRHFPHASDTNAKYLTFLSAVLDRQAALVAKWMSLGFIHGVMNTDNMTISGETIDYGPCAFMEAYDPTAAYSSIDRNGRYAYQNQPAIAQWNLARLAETLLPLLSPDSDTAVALASERLNQFETTYREYWLEEMRKKLGLLTQQVSDGDLIERWLSMLQDQQIDFTQAFYALSNQIENNKATANRHTARDNEINLLNLAKNEDEMMTWLHAWRARCNEEDALNAYSVGLQSRLKQMDAANPWIIPRNHRVEEALHAAQADNDYRPFESLLATITAPYQYRSKDKPLAEPAARAFTEQYKTFCGT